MNTFKADLHIHTCLSPCGEDEMTPGNIVREALKKELNIIGITDHNTVFHGPLVKKIAEQFHIFVLCGIEVTTCEEIHCLAFFENENSLYEFGSYVFQYHPLKSYKPDYYGHQYLIDEKSNNVKEIDFLLPSAISKGIIEVERKVHELSGLFIPSHINRPFSGLLSILGKIPYELHYDGLELNQQTPAEYITDMFPETRNSTFVRNSDSHQLSSIGIRYTLMNIENLSFDEIKLALHRKNGRSCTIR